MKIEHPNALRFLLESDIYLLPEDRTVTTTTTADEPTAVKNEQVKPLTFKYLGKNLRNFLIVTDYPGIDFIEEAHLSALYNSLQKKQDSMHPDDVAIFNYNSAVDSKKEDLLAYFKPGCILFLGIDPQKLGWKQLTLNTPDQQDGTAVLYTYSFNEMLGNKEKTIAFWNPMKNF
jgi:hypothetical protein